MIVWSRLASLARLAASRTHDMKVIGGEAYSPDNAGVIAKKYGLDDGVAAHLNEAYGESVRSCCGALRQRRISSSVCTLITDISKPKVPYAIEKEAVLSASDFICGRTTLALIDKKAAIGCGSKSCCAHGRAVGLG